jgi:hypothetical protein
MIIIRPAGRLNQVKKLTGGNTMSNLKKKKIKIISEQKTLPIQSPDARQSETRAAEQSPVNVERTKKWGEEHGT